MPTTTRGAFPYPAGADNWKTIRSAVQAVADRVAAATVLWRQTTAADRGNAGSAGTLHQASDTGTVSLDTGTAWLGLLTEAGGTITSSGPAVRGLVVKGAAGQTANLAEFQNSAGKTQFTVNSFGAIRISGNNGTEVDQGWISMQTSGVDQKGLVVRGFAGQTANLAEWQASDGTVVSRITSDGYLFSGPGSRSAAGSTQFTQPASNVAGLQVKGAAGQTQPIFWVSNSSNISIMRVDNGGVTITGSGNYVLTGNTTGGAIAGGTNSMGSLTVTVDGVSRRIPFY